MKIWREALKDRSFRAHLLFCATGFLILILGLPYFFQYLQNKPGIVLHDQIHELFEAQDFSLHIFLLIYGALIIFLIRVINQPYLIVEGLETYLLINILRALTLTLFTLEPAEGIVPLIDPFISKVAYGQVVYNKDLFFSGHTATLFLIFLLEKKGIWKWLWLVITCAVGSLLIIQKVHYTIDVLAAPAAAALALWLILKISPDKKT